MVDTVGRLVFEHHKTGLVLAAPVDGKQTTHLERLYLLLFHHGAFDTHLGGFSLQDGGESRCVEVHDRFVDPVAANVNTVP